MFFAKSIFFLIFSLPFFCGCSHHLSKRQEYLHTYQTGNFEKTEDILNHTIKKALPSGDFRQSPDAVWLLLDRGMNRFVEGDLEGSIVDFKLAIEAIDFYSQDSTTEMMGRFLLQDNIGAYAGEDFEQILARLYFALVLIQKGDFNNAFALLRQAEEIQQKKKELYRKEKLTQHFELVENPLAKYLMALLLEKNGDLSNAEILYHQAASLCGNGGQNLTTVCEDPSKATVLILVHNGNTPFKVSGTSNASVASAVALEILLSTRNIDPAWSTLTGIPIPILIEKSTSFPFPVKSYIDGKPQHPATIFDVRTTSYMQLQQQLPLITARGVARLLMRRGTVGYFKEKDPSLGALVDLTMLIANAKTQADTRGWTTLPSRIDLSRFDLAPGEHYMNIQSYSQISPPFLGGYRLNLKPNSLCVINVFNIHPGITVVQIPKQFILN